MFHGRKIVCGFLGQNARKYFFCVGNILAHEPAGATHRIQKTLALQLLHQHVIAVAGIELFCKRLCLIVEEIAEFRGQIVMILTGAFF